MCHIFYRRFREFFKKRMIMNYCISLSPTIYTLSWLIICLALTVRTCLVTCSIERSKMNVIVRFCSISWLVVKNVALCIASSISSFCSSSELRPEWSEWFPSNITSIAFFHFHRWHFKITICLSITKLKLNWN